MPLRNVTVAGAFDPFWEVLLSLHMLQERGSIPLALGAWRRRVRSAAGRSVSLRLLTELARPWGYSPDFLTPGRGDAGFRTQPDRVLSTPRSRLRAEFSTLAGESPATTWTRALGHGEPAALRRLGGALSTYHRIALAPYESAMRARVEADRARQAAALLDGGTGAGPMRLKPGHTAMCPAHTWSYAATRSRAFPSADPPVPGSARSRSLLVPCVRGA
ncbi:hypothetical protein V7793_01915 [Streptomyces sp. KLMMK]|uniref:hypothetical protein n=1 Tax=Streptomyces sp. KLMMK TaxID=3109353 RepID=UPI002FFFA663